MPAEEVCEFVRGHFALGTTILSICTGSFVVGYAGICKGKHVTGPRGLIPVLKQKFPDVGKWDDGVRFVRDGNLWTNGMSSSRLC